MEATRTMPALHYLNNGHGLASWLLTKDLKRIAIVYLVTISGFFFLGGLMAVGIRLELATPAEATLDRIGAQHAPLVRELVRNLVTAPGTRAVRDRGNRASRA